MYSGERQASEGILQIHRENLDELEKQAASHGITVPVGIHNSIRHEIDEIARLERQSTVTHSSLNPKYLRQLQLQANNAYCLADWEQAEELLLQIVALQPDDTEIKAMLAKTQHQIMAKKLYQMLCDFRVKGQWQAVLSALNDLGQQFGYVDTTELHSWASECRQREEQLVSLRAFCKKLLRAAEAIAADLPNSMTARELVAQVALVQQTIERFLENAAVSIPSSIYLERGN
jgi:hypothetical protein